MDGATGAVRGVRLAPAAADGTASSAAPAVELEADVSALPRSYRHPRTKGRRARRTPALGSSPSSGHPGQEERSVHLSPCGAAAHVPHPARTQAVVLATGGFAANRALLARHSPAAAALATTNGPWAQGEALEVAARAGARLRDLDQVQVHPTGACLRACACVCVCVGGGGGIRRRWGGAGEFAAACCGTSCALSRPPLACRGAACLQCRRRHVSTVHPWRALTRVCRGQGSLTRLMRRRAPSSWRQRS